MAQLMPLQLTVSCFTRVVPDKRPLNRCVCVCVCVCILNFALAVGRCINYLYLYEPVMLSTVPCLH